MLGSDSACWITYLSLGEVVAIRKWWNTRQTSRRQKQCLLVGSARFTSKGRNDGAFQTKMNEGVYAEPDHLLCAVQLSLLTR